MNRYCYSRADLLILIGAGVAIVHVSLNEGDVASVPGRLRNEMGVV